MALLLAPYHAGMRLGSGFNSYTQQLCIDGAVINEEPLKSEEQAPALQKVVGTEVAQSVIFKNEIIEKMSDLTDSLDVNGALNIKASNIANARGNGTFVNSNVIKESDLNYLITCKVVNQVIRDHSLTKFVPLSNPGSSNFTETFGDSFISGFQLGGEFTALISIKVHDKSQIDTITAEANIAFTTPNFVGKDSMENKSGETPPADDNGAAKPNDNVTGKAVQQAGKPAEDKTVASKGKQSPPSTGKGISIDADAKIKKTRTDIMSQNTVTMSVSWTGGGQQLKNEGEDWNFETLRAAAIKFPELVAMTPVRTHAILTKYTSLRSYHIAMSKNSTAAATSYENAGVHTTMLQDAYLDYKNMHKDLQLLGMDVDQDKKVLKVGRMFQKGEEKSIPAPPPPPVPKPVDESVQSLSIAGLETPGTDGSPTDEITGPVQGPAHGSGKSDGGTSSKRHLQKAFELHEPYPANLIGLELAKRDIRINMSRILQEVDEIAKNPELAMDEERIMLFMSPLLFKQYVPVGCPVQEFSYT